ESELAFHAQDAAGNIWNLGEYPAQYTAGQFTGAPDTWISGLAGAQGGTVIPGSPQVASTKFLQADAPPPKAGKAAVPQGYGAVASVGQENPRLCVPVGCYDNVLVVDENSPNEAGIQQKYYAPGAGNFKIGAINNDPQMETLVLSETFRLSHDECVAARLAALALEDQAYHHDTSQTVYAQTTPMEQTRFCESIQPTPTPPVSPTPTATPTPTAPPPPRPPQSGSLFLPMTANFLVGQLPPPPAYDGCKSDPNPGAAANFPVQIVKVDKVAEIVTLKNISN